MLRRWTQWSLFAILLTVPFITGCGKPAASTVEGTVSLDGTPIENGSISFVPTSADGKKGGTLIKDGKYSVPADLELPPGNYKVEISSRQNIGKPFIDNDTGEKTYNTKEALPERFNINSTLTADLEAGPNQKDFPLQLKEE